MTISDDRMVELVGNAFDQVASNACYAAIN